MVRSLLPVLVACGYDRPPENVAPDAAALEVSVSYPGPAEYLVGAANHEVVPVVTGARPTSFEIAPALSPGLGIDPTIGVIFGTATAYVSPTTYTIVARSPRGTAATQLEIIIHGAPTMLGYTHPTLTGVVGAPVDPDLAHWRGDAPAVFKGSSLPSGLVIDRNTGAISGTPSAVASGVAMVTATNSYGTATASLPLAISAP